MPFTKLVEKQKATPFFSGSPGKKKSAKRRKAYKLSLPLIPLVHEGDTRTDLLASCGSVRLSICKGGLSGFMNERSHYRCGTAPDWFT